MPSLPKKNNPKVSVVIAGHNRPHSLRETLKALREQSLSSKDYEVIVIGFPPTSLKGVAEENAKRAKHAFTYKEINSRWPDQKRNEGIRLARGKYIAFTDDDVLPAKDWLANILESFKKNPGALGIEGFTSGDNTPLLSHATKNEKGGEFPTCNLAFTKEILERVKGFDEVYHFFREDTDIAYKVLQHGPIVFDKHVKVFHPTRTTSAKSILNELGMTRGEIRLAKKFPIKYAEKYKTIFGLPGRGGWLQSLFSWGIVLLTAYFTLTDLSHGYFYLLCAIALLFVFRHYLSLRHRTWTPVEALEVWFYMLLRDLAYPFFFTYFWFAVENPQPLE